MRGGGLGWDRAMSDSPYILTRSEVEYERRWKLLHDDLRNLANSISLLNILHECKRTYLVEMNVSPAFYNTIEEALWSHVVVSTWKYFDKRRDVYGLSKHLEWVSKHLEIFTVESKARRFGLTIDHPRILGSSDLTLDDLAAYRRRYDSQRSSSKRIEEARHTVYAHRNESLLKANSKGVSLKEIKVAFNCIFWILDQISVCWDGTHYFAAVGNIGDITETLRIVKTFREKGGYSHAFNRKSARYIDKGDIK